MSVGNDSNCGDATGYWLLAIVSIYLEIYLDCPASHHLLLPIFSDGNMNLKLNRPLTYIIYFKSNLSSENDKCIFV